MIIKNCPAIKEITTLLTSEPPQFQKEWRCCTTGSNLKKCENINDCVMKRIIEKCKSQSYFVKRFPNSEYSDGVSNSRLADDLLQLLDIQECKIISEIEKMYENASVKQERMCEWLCKDSDLCSPNCQHYGSTQLHYPPFTAKKQLELIKWLGELDILEIMRTTREDKAWIINSEYGMSGNVYKHTSRMKSFEEALASLINSLWQSLTEEEKQQIKEILSE